MLESNPIQTGEPIMFRKLIVCALACSTLVGCDNQQEYDAWLDLQDDMQQSEWREADQHEVTDDANALLVKYECTYRCTDPRKTQTATVEQTSKLAAEAEVENNEDSNDDGILDFCPDSSVDGKATCKPL